MISSLLKPIILFKLTLNAILRLCWFCCDNFMLIVTIIQQSRSLYTETPCVEPVKIDIKNIRKIMPFSMFEK